MTAPNTHLVWVTEPRGMGPGGSWVRCRLTEKFVIVGSSKYRRPYGSLVGGSGFLRSHADLTTLRPLDADTDRILADQSYVWSNARKIGDAVARLTDAETLRKVAALVGVSP